MITLKNLTVIVFFAAILIACEKEESNLEFVDIPVVEAYLYAGNVFEMKVSRQIPFSGEAEFSADDINLLEIKVSDSLQTHTLSPMGDGVYRDTSLHIDENSEYEFEFAFNNRQVSGSTLIPSKPQGFTSSVSQLVIETGGFMGSLPDPVSLDWNNPDQSYYLVLVENTEENPEPIRDYGNDEAPASRFRSEPTQSTNYEINSRTFVYYGTHRVVLFHVNPDYAMLYDDDDNTSQNLTDPSTAISNGYGVFTGLNSDTLWINVNKE